MQLGHPFPGRNDRLAGRGMIFGFAVLDPERKHCGRRLRRCCQTIHNPGIRQTFHPHDILSELVQVFPECIVDLKIIGLMAGYIQKGFVPGKIKILS